LGERVIRSGDLEIWTEYFGDPADPTILLTAGPAPGIAWPDELCEELAAGERHVIRYDHRDTGRSTSIDFATHPYTISDMAADAVGVLDAYSVPSAHVVGVSMGGMIAQTVALEHPRRVASLASLMSTPWGASLGAAFQEGFEGDLPGPTQKIKEAMAHWIEPARSDQERIDHMVEGARAFAGMLAPFDEEEARDRFERVVTHSRDREAYMNHYLALAASPDRTGDLHRIEAPTLVIHGTVDPLFPLAHGEATARAIPGAKLLTIEGMGHDPHFPPVVSFRIVAALLEHTALVDTKS
jgi:pimeloyl-ACP methyl ester carboxylesterase